MATKDEKLAALTEVYRHALGAGLCRTQKEFAELLGVTSTTLSSAMNGSERHLTDSLVARALGWEARNLNGTEPKKPKRPDIVIPAETQDMYNNMARAIADLSDILRRAGLVVGNGLNIQKNFLRDDK